MAFALAPGHESGANADPGQLVLPDHVAPAGAGTAIFLRGKGLGQRLKPLAQLALELLPFGLIDGTLRLQRGQDGLRRRCRLV